MRCLIVHNYYQKRGGEDAVFEAESALLASAGHEIERFTLHNDQINIKSKIGLAAATIWNFAIHRQMTERIHAFNPDIVHFHNTFPLISIAAIQAASESGAAVVMTLHNFRLICPSANLFRDERICEDCLGMTVKWPAILHGCYRNSRIESAGVVAMLAAQKAITTFGSLVDRYVVLSRHSRSLFLRAGLPSSQTVVKPNFVSEPAGLASDLERERFALYVGRLVPEKGIPTLIEAWRGLGASAIPLVVAGEGPLAPTLSNLTNISWIGGRTRAEIYELMRRASFLVVPSEWYEPFGLVIIEAFANGLPVIASRIGAAEELIDSGRTGLLFSAGDPVMLAAAVRYASQASVALADMGKAAVEEYRGRYTPRHNLRQMTDIYSAAIKHRLSLR